MNYLDVYYSRVNHFGETAVDRYKNSGIVAFEKWMAQSPFTVEDLSVERGLYFSGIIQTNKDKEESKIMYLYVANDIPIVVGDILTWRQDNGAIEKWLLLQKEHKVHESYQTFQIIKCNYELKWIDADGYLHKSWAYAVSSVDSKVKSNFRMWHSLISPQPNKFAEIIMPRPLLEGTDKDQLMRGITFIIENEGWLVIECDWTSVEGIVYMSLTESKVNYEYDDRIIDVADTDKLLFPTLQAVYNIGDEIVPEFTAQTLNEWEIVLEPPTDTEYVEWNSATGHWIAKTAGQFVMKMRLKNIDADDPRKAVTKEFEITINADQNEDALFLKGADSIRLDRYATYELINENTGNPVLGEVSFSIANKTEKKIDLATIAPAYDTENNIISYAQVVHANAKNEIGEVTLSAVYGQKTYTKTIKVVPLW